MVPSQNHGLAPSAYVGLQLIWSSAGILRAEMGFATANSPYPTPLSGHL